MAQAKGRLRQRSLPPPVIVRTMTLPPAAPNTSRRRKPGRTMPVAMAVSIAAHLGLVAFMGLQLGSRRTELAMTDPPVLVSLEAKAAPPAPAPTEDPPSDEPRPPSTRPQPPRLEIEPRPVRTPIPPPFSLPLPEPAPRATPTSPSPPSRESAASPPPRPSAPPAPRVAGSVEATWQGRVMARLDKAKRYPRGARSRGIEGVAQVRFHVDRGGRVTQVMLARSSGHEDLDREAVAAVHRAQPLPRPPEELPGDPIRLTVEVEFHVTR